MFSDVCNIRRNKKHIFVVGVVVLKVHYMFVGVDGVMFSVMMGYHFFGWIGIPQS